MHVFYAQFDTLLVEREDHRIVRAPAARLTTPLGGIPLETQHAALFDLALDLLYRIGHARIQAAQRDNALRSTSAQDHIAIRGTEAGIVKFF